MDRAATAPRNRNAAAWSRRWRPPHAPSERAPVGQNVLPLRRDGKRRFGGQLTVKLGVRLSSRRTVLGSHLFPACPAAGSPPSPGKGGTQWARWSRRGVDRV